MLDVPELMKRLSEERPIFHSEADFQHALAWLIHRAYPKAQIRLERPIIGLGGGKARLDLWVEIDGSVDAVELKYQTRKTTVEVRGENFDLTNKGAEDNLGYDFLADIARVERVVETLPNCTGHAVLLSNEAVWEAKKVVGEFNKDAFRLHDGAEFKEEHAWKKVYPPSNPRANPISLRGVYVAQWKDYSAYGFRYLWVCAKGSETIV